MRVYFNVRAEAAPDLFGALTGLLDRYQTPFQLPGRMAFDDPVPLFTKRLGPGIGVAMEPGSGESFGAHRSRPVAEALVEAWRRGAHGRFRRSGEVLDHGRKRRGAAAPWPCGVPGAGETPNLMLGTAGIGHFLLRLHDPQGIPTPLLPAAGQAAVN